MKNTISKSIHKEIKKKKNRKSVRMNQFFAFNKRLFPLIWLI